MRRTQQEWIQYNQIPERFFDDPTDDVTPNGVSAVKAIAIAAQQGQKIYTLTQANQSQLANIQHRAEVMDEIRAALAAGKEVTVHQGTISYAGFNGTGYVIVDEETGSGAYLISASARGGLLLVAYGLLLMTLVVINPALAPLFATFVVLFAVALATLGVLVFLSNFHTKPNDLAQKLCKELVDLIYILAALALSSAYFLKNLLGAAKENAAAAVLLTYFVEKATQAAQNSTKNNLCAP